MPERTTHRLAGLSLKSPKPNQYFGSAASDPGEPTQTDFTVQADPSFDTADNLNHDDIFSRSCFSTQVAPVFSGMPYIPNNSEKQLLHVPLQQRHHQRGSDRRRQQSVEYSYIASPHQTSTSGAIDISSAVSSATGPEDDVMDEMMPDDTFSVPETNKAIKQTSHEELPDLFFGHNPVQYGNYGLNCSRAYADFHSFIRNSLKKHKSRGNMTRENISDQKYERALEIKSSITGRTMSLNDKHKEHYKLVRQVLFGTSLETPILECHNKGKHDVCRAKRSDSEKKGKAKAISSTECRGISKSNVLFGDNASNFHTNPTVSAGSQFYGIEQQMHPQMPSQHQAYQIGFSITPLEDLDHSTVSQEGDPFARPALSGGDGGDISVIRNIDRCINKLTEFRSLAWQGHILPASLHEDISKFAASTNVPQQSIGYDRALLPSSSTQQQFHRPVNPPPVQERMLAAGPLGSFHVARPTPGNLPLTPDGSSGSNRNRNRNYWPHRSTHGHH